MVQRHILFARRDPVFACWVAALCFYIVFMRQGALKPVLKTLAPAVLLLPFVYEGILIVRYFVWLRQFA